METKGKRRLLNVLMVILILVIAASGVVTVGMVRGWFARGEETALVSGRTKGVVNIERKSIGYTLTRDTAMLPGDLVETKKGAEAQFLLGEQGALVLNQNSEVQIADCQADMVSLQIDRGELFGDAANYGGSLEAVYGENQAVLTDAVFSASVQPGSWTLNIYAGDVEVTLPDGSAERVEAGEYLISASDTDGNITNTVVKMQPGVLSEFLITQAQACRSADSLCFSAGDLQAILDEREARRREALEANLNTQIPMEAETRNEEETDTEEAPQDSYEADGAGEEPQDTYAEEAQQDIYAEEAPQEAYVEEYVEEVPQEEAVPAKVCTIEIRCDTVLDNMDNLTAGKEAYVPANGRILDISTVEFTDGETVFDILQRVCSYAGIQLEYSWTPIYDSYYIEGINNLYEFDCGNESGWMFQVNGWFPNYGCSSYYPEDGDAIAFLYSCNGLGADVGGSVY